MPRVFFAFSHTCDMHMLFKLWVICTVSAEYWQVQFRLGTSVKVHVDIFTVTECLGNVMYKVQLEDWKSEMMLFGECMQINFALE